MSLCHWHTKLQKLDVHSSFREMKKEKKYFTETIIRLKLDYQTTTFILSLSVKLDDDKEEEQGGKKKKITSLFLKEPWQLSNCMSHLDGSLKLDREREREREKTWNGL